MKWGAGCLAAGGGSCAGVRGQECGALFAPGQNPLQNPGIRRGVGKTHCGTQVPLCLCAALGSRFEHFTCVSQHVCVCESLAAGPGAICLFSVLRAAAAVEQVFCMTLQHRFLPVVHRWGIFSINCSAEIRCTKQRVPYGGDAALATKCCLVTHLQGCALVGLEMAISPEETVLSAGAWQAAQEQPRNSQSHPTYVRQLSMMLRRAVDGRILLFHSPSPRQAGTPCD